jgi:6-phosphogluconolactonase (cycloisomerase 2 family)
MLGFKTPRRGRFVLAAAVTAGVAGVAAPSATAAHGGALYTQTNDPAGNAVQMFDRAGDGSLSAARTYPTGGVGLAALGGRQGAVELSDDEDNVFAVNAGSNTVTSFAVGDRRLRVVQTVASGGVAPASVDERDGRVYVLNSGAVPNVTAFAVVFGRLIRIGSRDLPGADGAAQVSVAPDGDHLLVSERVANRLESLPLDAFGRPGAPVATASSGAVPFGFAFGRRDQVVVSEAGASTVSSYALRSAGALATITASLPVAQGAACWVAVSPNGRFAYTGNASGSISGFAIAATGALTALNADGRTAVLARSPRDLDFSRDGRLLYAVSPGNATTGGVVAGYRVGADGSLTMVTSAPAAAGITGAAAA